MKALLDFLGLSQREAASHLGVSPPTINRWCQNGWGGRERYQDLAKIVRQAATEGDPTIFHRLAHNRLLRSLGDKNLTAIAIFGVDISEEDAVDAVRQMIAQAKVIPLRRGAARND